MNMGLINKGWYGTTIIPIIRIYGVPPVIFFFKFYMHNTVILRSIIQK